MGSCESQQAFSTANSPTHPKLGPVNELRILNCGLQRNYSGLYDYDSKHNIKSTLVIRSNAVVFGSEGGKSAKNGVAESYNDQKLKGALFQVVKKPNYFKVSPIFLKEEGYIMQKLLWFIVKTSPDQRYPLNQRDIIKLGKQTIRVREIAYKDIQPNLSNDLKNFSFSNIIYDDVRQHDNPNKAQLYSQFRLSRDLQSIHSQGQQVCRICLEPGQLVNPLICACKCIGSMRYLHLQCLRAWLGKRLRVCRSQFCVSVRWVTLTCEVCMSRYRENIYIQGRKMCTVEFPRPEKPYLVLEIMKRNSDESKVLHFISMSKISKISLGRKKGVNVQISGDATVSRHHANLIFDFERNAFLLEDSNSKYGTFVLIRKNILINPILRGLSVQIDEQIFAFEAIRGEGSISDYYDQPRYLDVREEGEEESEEDSISDLDQDEGREQECESQEQEEEMNQQNKFGGHLRVNNNQVIQHYQSSIAVHLPQVALEFNQDILSLPVQILDL